MHKIHTIHYNHHPISSCDEEIILGLCDWFCSKEKDPKNQQCDCVLAKELKMGQ